MHKPMPIIYTIREIITFSSGSMGGLEGPYTNLLTSVYQLSRHKSKVQLLVTETQTRER